MEWRSSSTRVERWEESSHEIKIQYVCVWVCAVCAVCAVHGHHHHPSDSRTDFSVLGRNVRGRGTHGSRGALDRLVYQHDYVIAIWTSLDNFVCFYGYFLYSDDIAVVDQMYNRINSVVRSRRRVIANAR